jgi:glutamate decarboxylase
MFGLLPISGRGRNVVKRGWIVPAYMLPPNADHITIMRIVVRQNFNRDMVDLFVEDVKKAFGLY